MFVGDFIMPYLILERLLWRKAISRGRIYALSGFEFTEYYFVVSDDRRQLIGIDAGTRADSAKVAYEATEPKGMAYSRSTCNNAAN
jgi:hypothetical protein